MTSVVTPTYERKCDECRRPYEHVKGAPTGWCPQCAARMLTPASEPPPTSGYHLPYTQPVEHYGARRVPRSPT